MPRSKYYTSNPERSIEINGKTYYIHMTFQKKADALEEARGIRDNFKKAKVVKWDYGWAVYEEA